MWLESSSEALLRVLITNHALRERAGSELYVRDVALGLLARGHTPIAYSPDLGEVARELRLATVPVIDDLDHLAEPPDLIHGHHHLETMTALLSFPGVPAVVVCHGWVPPEEAPPRFPRIRRYVAVDELVRERLVSECGIPPHQVTTLLNFVDLRLFPRRDPLPDRPRRALVFSNLASEENYVPAVRAACLAAGMTVEVIGLASGNLCSSPGEVLGSYDVVFAKGRAALEAAAVGAAVILCDVAGLGPLVTTGEIERLRRLNFGVRLLREPVSEVGVGRELRRYDARDAAEVTRRLRREADLDGALERIVSLHEEALAERRPVETADLVAEQRAAAAYLRSGPLSGGDFWSAERAALEANVARSSGANRELASRVDDLVAQRTELLAAAASDGAARAQLDESRRELERLRGEQAWMATTATWRWRERLVRRRWLVALYRSLTGRPGADPGAPAERALGAEAVNGKAVQQRAEEMARQAGFLGVPVEGFEAEGRLQLTTLQELGLQPNSRLLDLGCGVLRAGYWLIHFLDADRYCGIEPRRDRVELALRCLLEPEVAAAKRPRFDFNPRFDTAVFGETFDVFLAGSVWSHAAKPQIARMLDAFRRDTSPRGVFLTSYVPATAGSADDYLGDSWVGTSHESDQPGIVRHSFAWIEEECRGRGLAVHELPDEVFGGQKWLVIRRP